MVFFSIDTLKDIKEKPTLIVCNTDPSDKAGEHWILFFFYDDTVDFYDSLGHDITYYRSEFIDFIEKFANNFQYTVRRTQPIKTDVCGHYCIILLKNVKVILCKILLIIFLIKMMF